MVFLVKARPGGGDVLGVHHGGTTDSAFRR